MSLCYFHGPGHAKAQEFWLSPDAFPSQSVMACVELDEGNYQSLKDLKKSEAQRLAQKRVRELSAFILEQEERHSFSSPKISFSFLWSREGLTLKPCQTIWVIT